MSGKNIDPIVQEREFKEALRVYQTLFDLYVQKREVLRHAARMLVQSETKARSLKKEAVGILKVL